MRAWIAWSKLRALQLLLAATLLTSCAPLIAEYSLEAYKNATTLKAEVAGLIDKSGERFATRKAEVEALTTRINAAYEFAAGLPNNQIAAAQWQLIRDPAGGLYGDFVAIWMRAGTLSPAFRAEKKRQIGQAFDYLICLEANKQAPTSCQAAAAAAARMP
jgi:hypothetical protein